jgi:hypothetical protein
MKLVEWVGLALSISTLMCTFALMVKWLVKHYLSELKPNGGASMVDKVNRLESRVDDIYRLLVDK